MEDEEVFGRAGESWSPDEEIEMDNVFSIADWRERRKERKKKGEKGELREDVVEAYFEEVAEKNRSIRRRRESDRNRHNKKVKRDYRIK